MEEQIRRLNAEYGFNLSEDEIKLIVQQAEETERLLRPLNELDLIDVMPILKVEKKKVQRSPSREHSMGARKRNGHLPQSMNSSKDHMRHCENTL